jgi:hypothetical protein
MNATRLIGTLAHATPCEMIVCLAPELLFTRINDFQCLSVQRQQRISQVRGPLPFELAGERRIRCYGK